MEEEFHNSKKQNRGNDSSIITGVIMVTLGILFSPSIFKIFITDLAPFFSKFSASFLSISFFTIAIFPMK